MWRSQSFVARRATVAAVSLFIASGLALMAHAVVVNPGDVINVFGTSAAARPELIGATVYSQLVPFEIKSAAGALLYKGKLRSWVVYSNLTGENHLYHRIEQTYGGLTGKVHHLTTLGPFADFTTDLDYRTDIGVAADTGLVSVSRTAGAGSSVRWNFAGGGVPAGGRSRAMFVIPDSFGWDIGATTWIVLSTGEWTTVITPGPV